MRTHRLFLFLICFVVCSQLHAQKRVGFDQSFGLSITSSNIRGVAIGKPDSVLINSDFRLRLLTFGIVYGIRTNLVKWSSGSLSIGSPMMLGVSFSGKYYSRDVSATRTDTVQGLHGSNLAFDVPVYLDLNIGLHSASHETRQRFGVFVGAGYAYSYTKMKTSIGKLTLDGFDPVFHAGIRMGRSWEKRWSLTGTIRGRMEKGAIRTYGVQILKEL